jgi:hypothetical protein
LVFHVQTIKRAKVLKKPIDCESSLFRLNFNSAALFNGSSCFFSGENIFV